MAPKHLKRAQRPSNQRSREISERVGHLLDDLRDGGERRVRKLAAEYDSWNGPIVVDSDTIERARATLDRGLVDDIEAAHHNIRAFATAQRATIRPLSTEIAPGIVGGHHLLPVNVAGCYIPAGRFAHIASALMSVTTASVAGVDTVIATSPARPERAGVHPAILVAADMAGADIILGLGGVQAIAALAQGLFTGRPADMIVGPGNALVAEAKRQLFGQIGIDVVAGPTESMIAADHTADPNTVAIDLVGQAEHGPDSPVWLVTTSEKLAAEVAEIVPCIAEELPEPNRTSAMTAWENHGEIVVVDTREEAAETCDRYAPEHLQVLAADLDWWKQRLSNYGSLFLGPETTVTFGDKSAGPNHILPTGRASRYTGGLNVLTFLRTPTWQQMSADAAARQGALSGRISRFEGMEGHARSADARVDIGAQPEGELPHLHLDLTSQEPLPQAAIDRANELMRSGQLFRYGESCDGGTDAALLEEEFAALVGRRYCVAFNSCGASMAAALMAAGVQRDEPVLMNTFTLAPVPGAIAHAGAEPVFVGITPDYHIDLEDLRLAAERTDARWLLLSYMRGHIPDLDVVMQVCDALGITVIEDCAHSMGAGWRGRATGTFGLAGCFSTQSFKHVNSGEGGLLVTDDDDVAARAVLLSGSYMLYGQHGATPDASVFEHHRLTTPNLSMRMSALAAALVRPQLAELADRARRWNERYVELAGLLDADPRITVPTRHRDEHYVASSIQFSVDSSQMADWIDIAGSHGVHVKWFGRGEPVGFTSNFDHWRFAAEQTVQRQGLQRTQHVLSGLCDMRIPLAMTRSDAADIASIIRGALDLTETASR
ncbi:MAG: histidinol dehydrogenase [Actinomycetia bacterium]|nr:histidinol dehydrogenase [Actinomycetes bacterium]